MPAASSIVLEGVLDSNGTLKFGQRPALPPGPVRVTLEALPKTSSEANGVADKICDAPMLDAWAEFPLAAKRTRLHPKLAPLPLPDPPVISVVDGEA
jgi:hypothetical protein